MDGSEGYQPLTTWLLGHLSQDWSVGLFSVGDTIMRNQW
jgi:hypothetical protein